MALAIVEIMEISEATGEKIHFDHNVLSEELLVQRESQLKVKLLQLMDLKLLSRTGVIELA